MDQLLLFVFLSMSLTFNGDSLRGPTYTSLRDRNVYK